MSTILNTNGDSFAVPKVKDKVKGKFYVITAEWNSRITHSLRDGAIATLKAGGVDEASIEMIKVPGTVELVNAAALAVKSGLAASVIVLGCVIRGDTPHFDYVCQSVTQGITHLNSECDIPVIFGVLTVDCLQDAIDRAGGKLGNKGAEAAQAALLMYDFCDKVENL